jgi:peptide/nickel transport system substrate-binding protein
MTRQLFGFSRHKPGNGARTFSAMRTSIPAELARSGLPGDPSAAWGSQLHSYVPGGGWGIASYISDPEVDALIEQAKRTMEPMKRNEILRNIARLKHEQVYALTTYLPLATLAWRTDKVDFKPWPAPGTWHQMQELGLKK